MQHKRAVGWAYGLTWGRQAIQAVTTLVLAALVGPAEFGVMALALVYIGFIEIILQQGFVAAIVQKKRLKHRHVTSVFWLIVALSFVLAALGVSLARYWAAANRIPTLEPVIHVLSLTIPLVALGMVPTALLTRHMAIRALTIRNTGAAFVSSIVAIAVAVAGRGVWALVAMHLTYTTMSTVLVWSVVRWRPRLLFDWTAANDLVRFSLANFAARAGTFVVAQADAVVIGLFWGPTAVGLYRLAARFVTMAMEFLAGPLQFISFPQFSKVQDDIPRFREGLIAYLRFAAVVTWPALCLVALAGPYVAPVLGSRWTGVEYALVPLAIYGALATVTEFIVPLLQAMGRPGTLALVVWTQGVVGAMAFTAVGRWLAAADLPVQTASIGAVKVGMGLFVAFPVFLLFCRSLLALAPQPVVRILLPAAGVAASVGIVGWLCRVGLQATHWHPILQLSCMAAASGGVWFACAAALSEDVRRLASRAVRRVAPAMASHG